jgi:hypothetical protein
MLINTFLTSEERHCFAIKTSWLRQFRNKISVHSKNNVKYMNIVVRKIASFLCVKSCRMCSNRSALEVWICVIFHLNSSWRMLACIWTLKWNLCFSLCVILNKKLWEELIACFPLIWHGPHRKRHVQQLFYCWWCFRCSGNVFTEPLPNNVRGMNIQTYRLTGEIYEARRWYGFTCHFIYIPSVIKIGSGIQKLIRGIHRQHGDLTSLLLFFSK